jgi:hypothetical protein
VDTRLKIRVTGKTTSNRPSNRDMAKSSLDSLSTEDNSPRTANNSPHTANISPRTAKNSLHTASSPSTDSLRSKAMVARLHTDIKVRQRPVVLTST